MNTHEPARHPSPRLRPWLALCLACALLPSTAAALRPEETPAEAEAVAEVVNALQHADCPRAAARLNAGLKERYPGIYLLAGSMYENGTCLKPSWERAERMYLLASEAGHRGGTLRLVAGLAERGRDLAAALWWLQQEGGLPVPAECRVAGFVADAPEAFVATLRHWPQARLIGCTYVAGVLAHLISDVDYPVRALDFGVGGEVALRWQPAEGAMQWRTVQTQRLDGQYGAGDSATLVDGASRRTTQALEDYLRGVGEQALRRYARPAGIDPGWVIEQRIRFSVTVR